MKPRQVMGSFLLVALTISPLIARADVQKNPHDASENVYVGHYQEVVRFPADMAARTQVVGETEVVDFYSKLRPGKNHISVEFDIDRATITPELIAREDLIEMIVAPSSASQFASLDDLRSAKIADLKKQGAEFRVMTDPYPTGYFGEGSFEVRIDSPYRLTQLYTQTSSHRFILTGRRDYPNPGYFDDMFGIVRVSLGEFVQKSRQIGLKQPAPTRNENSEGFIQHQINRWLSRWLPMQAVMVILMIALWKSKYQRMRWAFVSAFVFSNAFSLLAWVFAYWIAGLPGVSDHWFAPTAAACTVLLIPGDRVMRWASDRKMSRAGIVLLMVWAATLACGGFFFREITPTIWLPLIPVASFALAGVIGAIIGLIWGVFSGALAT